MSKNTKPPKPKPLRPSFLQAYVTSLKVEGAYWVIAAAFLCAFVLVDSILEMPALRIALVLFMCWLGFGFWYVFVTKKTPSAQAKDRFDLRGALKNLYLAALWPWYLKRRD